MYKIDQRLLEEILNYLAKQPYNEVARIINKMSQLKPKKEDNKKNADTKTTK